MTNEERSNGSWSGQLGFLLAAAGSSIGLGNIWRFPYMTGMNGGGAFVLIYLLVVLLIGVPLMMAEIALGRAAGSALSSWSMRTVRPSPPVRFSQRAVRRKKCRGEGFSVP